MITRDELIEVVEYCFKANYDDILYITDDKNILSFKFNNITTGLEGIKNFYKEGGNLGIKSVDYNGKILNEKDRLKLFDKLFKE